MKFYIFTIWIQDDGGYFDHRQRRQILRLPGMIDDPNHDQLRAMVIGKVRAGGGIQSMNARVEFGPISESKRQG